MQNPMNFTWIVLRLEASLEESLDVAKRAFFHFLDLARLGLRIFVPRKFSSEPVDHVEQQNFKIASTRYA